MSVIKSTLNDASLPFFLTNLIELERKNELVLFSEWKILSIVTSFYCPLAVFYYQFIITMSVTLIKNFLYQNYFQSKKWR